MKLRLALLCALGVAASANALACYTVFDSANRVVYNGDVPPVDMSLPVHETVQRAFPGGHMVFDAAETNCPRAARTLAQESDQIRVANRGNSSPLLTDRQTAERLNLPHANVASNIAVVPAQVAAKLDLPTFTVIPSDAIALAAARPALSTTAMGAGPAPHARSARPAAITELRDSDIPRARRSAFR